MSTTAPRTTAAVGPNGRPIFIGAGAVAQDGNLKLYTCNTCGQPVVWAKSTRTGRAYLANVFSGASGARYYVKASAHSDCTDPSVTMRADAAAKVDGYNTDLAEAHAWAAEIAAMDLDPAKRANAVKVNDHQIALVTRLRDEAQAIIDAIDARKAAQ